MSYLRQPSPLSFEPLSPSQSDIVTSDSECEIDADSRKAKRRRVEDLGRQYLAGRPLFIQSASLRGPFDKGWVNPWKKPRRGSPRHRSTNEEERLVGTDLTVQSVAEDQAEDVSSVARGHPELSRQASRSLDKVSMTGGGWSLATRPERVPQGQLFSKKQEQRGSRKEERPRTSGLPEQGRATRALEPAIDPTRPLKRPQQDQTPRSLISAANEWLKSDDGYLAEGPRGEARSPTPTPTSRANDGRTPLGQYADQHTPMPGPSREKLSALSRPAAFTPINVPSRSPKISDNQDAQRRKEPTSRSPSNAPMTVKRARLFSPQVCQSKSTEAGAVGKAGGQRTKSQSSGVPLNGSTEAGATARISRLPQASQDPASRPSVTDLSRLPTRRGNPISRQRPAVTMGEPLSPRNHPPLTTARRHSDSRPATLVLNKASVKDHEFSELPQDSRSRIHTVPPSTNMSAFKFRRPVKTIPGPRLEGTETRVGPSTFEAGQIQKPRRLDFTSSEDSPHKADAAAPTAQTTSEGSAVHNVFQSQHGGGVSNSSRDELSVNVNNPGKEVSIEQTDDPSRVSSILQEAQVVPDPAVKDPRVPSASSTGLIETDKQSLHFSTTETDDASAHLSTQAAIAKAQLSFKADLASPIKQCSVPFAENKDCNGTNYPNVTSVQKPKHNITPFQTFRTPSPEVLYKRTPVTNDHLSTQQMIDAVTPFAFSTTKKPTTKRISFTTSITDGQSHHEPNHVNGDHGDFGRVSLDMDTSPDTSGEANVTTRRPARGQALGEKEVSSANSSALPVSFSIAPNGTLKEVSQQDGQVEAAVMDLGAVLDDVGSFLQSWDIEAELKKSTGPSTTGPANSGSRVHTGISSARPRSSKP